MGLIDDIKKDAINNRTKIQSSDSAKLEAILNKMFYCDKNPELESNFVKQVITRGLESQERVGLHASALIKGDKGKDSFCLRELVLSLLFKQLQGEQINSGLKRIFEEGNAVHEKWQRLFIRAGYANVDELDVTKFNKKYRVSFTPDIICKIPEFYDGKMIVEIKSVNTFQFQKMDRHPSAYKQLQWYMYLCDIKKGFVLCEDKNTQEFKTEVYDYNPEIFNPFIDRAEEVKYNYNQFKKTGNMIERPSFAKSPESKRCLACSMRDACWNIGMGRVKI